MGRVERLLSRCVVRRIHNFLDFRGDPFQHDFESLPQRHLRGRTSLAAAAHGDEKLPLKFSKVAVPAPCRDI